MKSNAVLTSINIQICMITVPPVLNDGWTMFQVLCPVLEQIQRRVTSIIKHWKSSLMRMVEEARHVFIAKKKTEEIRQQFINI